MTTQALAQLDWVVGAMILSGALLVGLLVWTLVEWIRGTMKDPW